MTPSLQVAERLLASALASGTVLLLPTLGEIMGERSGVLNLGLEGMMLAGAFFGFAAALWTGNPYVGILAGMAAGGLCALLHGFISITLGGNQTVSGLALTIFGLGITGTYGDPLLSARLEHALPSMEIPGLSSIPFLGRVLFDHDLVVYLSWLLALLLWFLLNHTRPGIELRAVGENARAAAAMGVPVRRTRYLWTVFGGVCAGAGGAYLTCALHPYWLAGITAGRGWIAVALVVFAMWNPLYAVLGAWLFGSVQALQLQLQASGTYMNSALLSMLPYLLTFLAVVGASVVQRSRHGGAPAELGEPFHEGER
jgi:simple sugar transport system permease protein